MNTRTMIFIIILIGIIHFIPIPIDATTSNNQIVYQSQKKLIDLGYKPGPTDGIFGKRTQASILKFQRDQNIPVTGNLDTITKLKLDISSNSTNIKSSQNQITPHETIGVCLESKNLFREYKINMSQFNENFNQVPLCVSGYPSYLGENQDYFYIDIYEVTKSIDSQQKRLNLQCRIEKLNTIHQKILKKTLSISKENLIKVKGIYKTSLDSQSQDIILDQCYLVQR